MSSFDAGLIAGLTGHPRVLERITEGDPDASRRSRGRWRDRGRRAIVVGSGAGGRPSPGLQVDFDVTVLESGHEFRRATVERPSIERIRRSRLLVDPRLLRLVYPTIRVRRTPDMLLVNGIGTGGTTTMATGNGPDGRGSSRPRARPGEFDEIADEIPITTAHQRRWHPDPPPVPHVRRSRSKSGCPAEDGGRRALPALRSVHARVPVRSQVGQPNVPGRGQSAPRRPADDRVHRDEDRRGLGARPV